MAIARPAPGPLLLAGSGEFTEVMEPVDASVLAGRAPRLVVLPTAAGLEGDASVTRWSDMGRAHGARLGVATEVLPVLDRAGADDASLADRVAGAGLVYFSGGDPGHLAATMAGSAVWRAVVEAWAAGAALGGCSAGAMVQGGLTAAPRTGGVVAGLGTLPGLAVIPHFDRYRGLRSRVADSLADHADIEMLGVDEDTAIVFDPTRDDWRVHGVGRAHLLDRAGAPVASAGHGETLGLAATPVVPTVEG